MAAAYDPSVSNRDEWKLWSARENATLLVQTAIGVYDSFPLTASGGAVKRRAITWKEMAASAGAYTDRDRAWLLPLPNLPADVVPKPGDVIQDANEVNWTIGDVQVGKFGLTFKCVARALAIVNELSVQGQLKRAPNASDAAGRPALLNYANVGSAVACRVQPQDSDATEVFDRVAIVKKYTAYLAAPLSVQAHDQFVADGVTYTVLGFRNPERIWDLMSLDLQVVDTAAANLSPNDIVSITDDGNGSMLVTTAAAHGLESGVSIVTISGTSLAAYNGPLTPVDTTPSPTTFVSFNTYLGDSTGGTWTLV